ncbi:molybdenum cofactor guanylyltransferase [Paenibacillus aestuarii]|uniref:Molybdenum cofactor guanylyltransferase n=1 Tax=Paenibacillus aestuarii TaxID=516965 RepID=A0ABW0KCF2_9BACL|nr:molybdenum cofactor guanylyltransferase [Paenibacillus aestuarii]
MLTGVILAGGVKRRMNGTLKSLLPFDGQPLIVRQINQMRSLCDELMVVTDEPRPLLPVLDPSVRVITDFFKGCGALGGLHAALSLAGNSSVWIVGGDMPFLSSEAAKLMWKRKSEGLHAVIPRIAGELVPLHGIYDRASTSPMIPLLERGESKILALLDHIIWGDASLDDLPELGAEGNLASSIRTMQDYEALQQGRRRL